MKRRRNICFVTGTRAEFGLMRTTLEAIRKHRELNLQLVVTGMHLDPRHGESINSIRAESWSVDKVVAWPPGKTPAENAAHTGAAVASLAAAFETLRSDIVLVTGDRVEAFAAATAAHISHRALAHVHGGDRALGQVDDALRHAITKLSHLHFPATKKSAQRIRRLGEDTWRIHVAGSPGIDGILQAADSETVVHKRFPGLMKNRYALLLLHSTDADTIVERKRALQVIRALRKADFEKTVIIYPNNDPGSAGIIEAFERQTASPELQIYPDVPRATFLGLLREAAVLIGNSSSGMIEAASFGTPVVNIGNRQMGREHSANVINVPFDNARIREALETIWNNGHPLQSRARNVYGGDGAGLRIAKVLAKTPLDARLMRKLITF